MKSFPLALVIKFERSSLQDQWKSLIVTQDCHRPRRHWQGSRMRSLLTAVHGREPLGSRAHMEPITTHLPPDITKAMLPPWTVFFSPTLLTQETPPLKTHPRSSLIQEIIHTLLGWVGALRLHSHSNLKAMHADDPQFLFPSQTLSC